MSTPSKQIICAVCHKSGHRSYQCPLRSDSDGSSIGNSSASSRSQPPRPCWSCPENHWASECPTTAERKLKGACLLCGSTDHWIKACSLYAERVGASPTQAARTGKTWCLRHGNSEHTTSKCTAAIAAIDFPPVGEASEYANICLWCGIPGHSFEACIR